MKKISLKSVKEYLSRDEMRMISGGSGLNPKCYFRCADGSEGYTTNCTTGPTIGCNYQGWVLCVGCDG